jgi:diguanylate cyclase (GGDEF)-like protein
VINELHGFELGNELIVRIADLLAPPLLPEDGLRARLSGDRFAVVLPAADTGVAATIAAKIQAAARELRIGPAEGCVEASVSCGVADVVAMPQALDRAIAAAEIACKSAKSRGRDRVAVYNPDDNSMMQRRSDAVAVGELRAALKSDRLLLYAERLKSLRDASVPDAFQLSLRMLDEDEGVISPASLLHAAVRYQLMPSVDRWVVQNALEMLAPFRAVLQSSGVSFALRISGQSMADTAFVEHFAAHLSAARLPHGCILVSVGEALAGNLVRAGAAIERLEALGCGFALAGFGIGTHAIDYIKNFHITRVEIDAEFVRNLARDGDSRAAVRAIVELAGALSLQTAAAGVDDPAQRTVLRDIGVDFACGAAYEAPRPLDDLLPSLGGDESRRMRRLYLET